MGSLTRDDLDSALTNTMDRLSEQICAAVRDEIQSQLHPFGTSMHMHDLIGAAPSLPRRTDNQAIRGAFTRNVASRAETFIGKRSERLAAKRSQSWEKVGSSAASSAASEPFFTMSCQRTRPSGTDVVSKRATYESMPSLPNEFSGFRSSRSSFEEEEHVHVGTTSIAKKALAKLRRQGKVKMQYHDDATFAEMLLRHPNFEQFVGILVLLNAIFLGIETDMGCRYHGNIPGHVQRFINIEEACFCFLFLAEWMLRLSFAGVGFFTCPEGRRTNIFDTIVVVLMLVEELVHLFLPSEAQHGHHRGVEGTARSLLNVIRCVRIVRIVRLLHLFPDLQTQVKAIAQSLTSLFGTLLLLVLTIFCFSVMFAQWFVQARSRLEPEETHEVDYFYGSLPRTALTLLECIIDGKEWDDPFMVMFNVLGPAAVPLFLFYELFGVFVILNTIMGAFVDKAIKVAEAQTELDVACGIALAFVGDNEADEGITWQDFSKKLAGEEMQQCFEFLNLDISQGKFLFDLIDVDQSQNVSAHEILEGCLKLKGVAKALDMSIMLKAQEQVYERQSHMIEQLEQHMDVIDQNLYKVKNSLAVHDSRVPTFRPGELTPSEFRPSETETLLTKSSARSERFRL